MSLYHFYGADAAKGAILPDSVSGFKGFRVSADYTVAKNMVTRVSYFDLKGKDEDAQKRKTIYGEMIVTF